MDSHLKTLLDTHYLLGLFYNLIGAIVLYLISTINNNSSRFIDWFTSWRLLGAMIAINNQTSIY